MLLVTTSAAVLSLLVASAGEAITISGVVVSTNSGDSGSSLGFFGDYGSDSVTSVTDSGGSDAVGASVAAGTRYAQYTWADRDSGSTTLDTTSDYSVVLQITPDDANSVYDIQNDTTRLGALTLIVEIGPMNHRRTGRSGIRFQTHRSGDGHRVLPCGV